MEEEVNQISFDEFEEIFRAKMGRPDLEPIRKEQIIQAWNVWQQQVCFLCKSNQVKFRALFEPTEKDRKDYGHSSDMPRLLTYSLCDVCFDHKDIEYISDCLLKAAMDAWVH